MSTSTTSQNAVVLLSGGLDSVTCLYWAKANYTNVTAVSFNYGQRHNSELNAAKKIAATAQVNHRIIDIDLAQLGGSALTDASLVVPDAKQTDFSDNQHNDSIPITYVPARNTIFLSYALALAEVTQSNAIVIGVNAVDYSGYPDCRPEYIAAFEKMANLATKAGVMGNHLHIATPLLHLSKAEIIKLGVSLGVDYALTVSCYRADSEGRACGHCDSCYLRQQGFLQAEIDDPTIYQ
ncbi:MAG: 7-cyano-7-deazaguanine synthase QueC [Gammaproteobacteria bacterium]|uniref:7-cyano-7-deazaguanine synthase n=1 Tax=Faucicola osloensis TaxID=34062 RepID=A0A6P1KBN3_FAUOS|nr:MULTISPECIES: 7-cyano-7-deazaguanine synthase QueC [Moraxella]NOX78799.1 7-cyano-7-deazaguanine synthase QueC [Gammaproteobacteria bacterium]HCN14895.1 7-cyano-7-deazaguanine synthase QueC [Moraxellaceae bacterium]MBL7667599.1 7-cyano-7-deazaguanine synthase QueC [Moraxella osloensis]NPA78300.1 7-cyano-7-deazaguanine synthase QueC [Gammaproteobacteria bacterium]QHG09499.1 7-cyano-7-deazaguanine synthase QueC [Moraxella osloensis]